MNLKALKDSVVIESDSAKAQSASGLVFNQENEHNSMGVLVSINDKSEKFTKEDVGKRVFFIKYVQNRVSLDNKDYYVVKEEDVTAFVE